MIEDGVTSGSIAALSRVEVMDNISRENVEEAKKCLASMQLATDANTLYQTCFTLLKMGGLAAEIPRLVVFGQQSMGKTTLLDYIMGGPIGYSSTTTGTRHPVVILIKPQEVQEEGGPIMASLDGATMEISQLPDAMRHLMENSPTISDKEVTVELRVPGGVSALFVDLPGIKDDSKEGADLTRSVVRSYVRNNPHDLYVLVKKASDDPANWPWQLRDFILKDPPKGLGLKARQCMTVGTRALDFIKGERNDVGTLSMLLRRVKERAVPDPAGVTLPLFLLELFSLGRDLKDSTDFDAKRNSMFNQISAARSEIMEILETNFQADSPTVRKELMDHFDIELFKKQLNSKFQSLLTEQLNSLERRLHKKRITLQKEIMELSMQVNDRKAQTCREFIKLFVRELMTRVTELVTGNYNHVMLRGEKNSAGLSAGEEFLAKWGGNLEDNLREGHELAKEIFARGELYDRNFLEKVLPEGSCGNPRRKKEEEADEAEENDNNVKSGKYISNNNSNNGKEVIKKVPEDPLVGKEVRVEVKRRVLWARCLSVPSKGVAKVNFGPAPQKSKFSSKIPEEVEELSREVERASLTPVVCMTSCVHPVAALLEQGSVRGWYKKPATTGKQHQALEPLEIRSFVRADGKSEEPVDFNDEKSIVAVVRVSQQGPGSSEARDFQSPLNILYIDHALVQDLEENLFDNPGGNSSAWMSPGDGSGGVPTLWQIAGDYSETKLLNQLSLTHLGRWLKFHIGTLEPDRSVSERVLLQMMRSVQNVIDKADWEPVVADLLQVNVRGGFLFLSRLTSCATAVALRRILRASVSETCRLVKTGELAGSLEFLADNPKFVAEVEMALDEYCSNKAQTCASNMRDFIFEQTHALQFEMIEDFFTGCEQFEKDFIGTISMRDVIRRVRDDILSRKKRLGVTDVYARDVNGAGSSNQQPTIEGIYEEVRIQFWVVKMLLAAPLTTKLYMHFVKDIKDKSPHLAAEGSLGFSSESTLERYMQDRLLCETTITPLGRSLQGRTDDELASHFDIDLSKDEAAERLEKLRRVEEYVKLALEGVSRLRASMTKDERGVDFLMRLDKSMSLAGKKKPNVKAIQPAATSAISPPRTLVRETPNF